MVHQAVGGAIAGFALVEAMITASAVTVLQVCAAAVTCNKHVRRVNTARIASLESGRDEAD